MGITTHLVQAILVGEMATFTLLLVPVPRGAKRSVLRTLQSSKLYRGFLHILYVLFAMILVMFVDSAYKMYTGEDEHNPFVLYQAERNLYLTGFTLFLALIFRMFADTMLQLFREEESALLLKKQSMNQKEYVQGILESESRRSEQIAALDEEAAGFRKQITANDILIKQLKNNQSEYFSLLDKYNALKEQMRRESKKSK